MLLENILQQKNSKCFVFIYVIFFLVLSVCANAGNKSKKHKVPGYAVASAHPLATAAGIKVLASGGNAFDAAVAVSSVLAVVEPYSSGMGGGGLWLLYHAKSGKTIMVDGREKAPAQATRNMYLDKQGQLIKGLSINGVLSAGIPGQVAALVHIAKKYGKLPLSKSMQASIRLAENGFRIDPIYIRLANFRLKSLQNSTESKKILLDNGKVPAPGYLLRQRQLANTLRLISRQGHKGFYQGSVARKLVDAVRSAGGIWTLEDLKNYKIVERQPIVFQYRGIKVTSASLPSSGGIVLAEIFNMLEILSPAKQKKAHLIIEAMRFAYRDRARYLGDADFVKVAVKKLISKQYAKSLTQKINPSRATPSSSLTNSVSGSATTKQESRHTTHFSIIDNTGNRVAATLTINYPFGSGFIAKGTGILLNDEMDDFSSKPGSPNAYGLVGAEANAIAANKRPLSSMSPTFLETADRIAVLGTPGGSRIITMVMNAIFGFEQNLDAKQIVAKKRYHHQYLPDVVQYETGALTVQEIDSLQKKGHKLKQIQGGYGNMQIIIWDKQKKTIEAASDPRGIGAAKVSVNQ